MEGILDFSRELDINLFDQVVNTLFSGHGAQQQQAQSLISQFQEHPDAWSRADFILTSSPSLQSKYIALQVLEKLIQTKWKILPREQCNGIRDFIVGTIIKISNDPTEFEAQKVYLNKLNLILVQILKHEWPGQWPNFMPEIVSSSRTSLTLCENNMVILKLLSEEIFDFSAEQMTSAKTKNLKQQLCGEFSKIYELCEQVLQKAQKPSLIKVTLETLLRFLNWVPLGFVFETTLIEMLRSRFLEVAMFRNITLKCLTEIGSLSTLPMYDQKLGMLYTSVIESFSNIVPMSPSLDLASAFENGSDEEQEFIQNMALFLTSFFSEHLTLLEQSENKQPLLLGHLYLLKVSKVDDREVFKICLEYWTKLVAALYNELPSTRADAPLFDKAQPARKLLYSETLSQCRVVMIESMVRPEEVLIVENDEGEIIREFIKETDTIQLYKSIREVLVYLTHLDPKNTEYIMSDKLTRQVDRSEWSWNNLNKLCWAVGSISGAMSEEDEKRFIVNVIKELLGLCESVRGKDNKAVVASNIMYVVGQYPRFLRMHWKFLKTVVNKLFEFMHETHEGVQDMACDTFIKIAQKCKRLFVVLQPTEVQPFVEEIIMSLSNIISLLSPSQVHTFYEAVGTIISAQTVRPVQDKLILDLMEGPNAAWASIINAAMQNPELLNSADQVKQLGNIMKTNVAACTAIGSPFIVQIGKIYMDMLNLYRASSELISQAVAEGGLVQTKTPRVRGLRTIKKEVLKLLQTYVLKAENLEVVVNNIVPPLFDAVLADYKRNVEPARDAEVLSVMASIVQKLGPLMTDKVPAILDSLFQATLDMINKDFQEYPEHRVGFYTLLKAINSNCFVALLGLPAPTFKLVLDSIVWGFKHPGRDIADVAYATLLDLLTNVANLDSTISSGFFQNYYVSILQDVFYVLTDREHKSGFKYQAQILAQMCIVVDSGAITAPMFSPAQVTDPSMTNQKWIREYLVQLLQAAFPNLQPAQVTSFVVALFDRSKDMDSFKQLLRDFLIQIKEFAGTDTSELFLEERETEQEQKKKADLETAMRVPGMLKPSELLDTDD